MEDCLTVTNEAVKSQDDPELPKDYKVILLNDEKTTMLFVVQLLRTIFNKSPQEAEALMLRVHNTGRGICGIYTREIAETKVAAVKAAARNANFPLQCIMEEN